MTDIYTDERLKSHEILIEAHGEDDYYDKVQLVAEMEKCYDDMNIGGIKTKIRYAHRENDLIRSFMIEYKKIKESAR